MLANQIQGHRTRTVADGGKKKGRKERGWEGSKNLTNEAWKAIS